jgi:exonuclease-1
MLIHFGVIPYLVFDGDYLPSKAATEEYRSKKRMESKRIGLDLHRMGKSSLAQQELQKAVDVTPEMARQLIEELKQHKIQYVVAPYEADAQLVYLERKGIIHGVLSEDSDLLVFGSKLLLTKLDKYGDCVAINRSDFTACREISLVGWSDAEFRMMAILSGCDYLTNINKMGLRTAYHLVRKHKTIEKILRTLQYDGQFRVPAKYLEEFYQADLTFLHQRVFCPEQNKLVMSIELGNRPEPEDFSFIGKDVEPAIAIGVAVGDLHPMTKLPIVANQHPRRFAKTAQTISGKQSDKDLKTGVSIERYFKARRIPLAELDPNSFTPSPSQRQLLERHNETWLPSPVPNGSTSPTTAASGPPPRGLGAPPGVSSVVRHGTSIPSPAPYPSKRQRLCEDGSAEKIQCQTTEFTGRSRFFISTTPDPSPLVKKTLRNKSKRMDMNIWSDDSVEDIMAGIPDLSDAYHGPAKAKEIAIFQDVGPKTIKIPTGVEDTQDCDASQSLSSYVSTSSSVSRDSSCLRSEVTQTSMSSFDQTQSLAGQVDALVKDELAVLFEKYSYNATAAESVSRAIRDIPVASAVKQVPCSGNKLHPQAVQQATKAALRRVQTRSPQRSNSLNDISPTLTAGKGAESCLASEQPLVSASPPCKAQQLDLAGSEDCLVPNSDDDLADEDRVTPGARISTFDLRRFRCQS